MATTDGPLRLRVLAGKIEERGGVVLATLNQDATPSILDSFVNFIEDCAEYGPTDEVYDCLFPEKKKSHLDPSLKGDYVTDLQRQADDDYDAFLTYDELRTLVNQESRQAQVPTLFVLQMLRNFLKIEDEADGRYTTAAREEQSYRNAHEDGSIYAGDWEHDET